MGYKRYAGDISCRRVLKGTVGFSPVVFLKYSFTLHSIIYSNNILIIYKIVFYERQIKECNSFI